MSNYINTAAECTVKQYEACRFEDKLSVLLIEGEVTNEELREAFEFIHGQYVDLSGLYETREFEMSAYINSLTVRINTVHEFIRLQLEFISQFKVPYVPGFYLVKEYGHKLHWDHEAPDIDTFLSRLEKMEMKEAKFKSELKRKEKELSDLQQKKSNGEFTPLESRRQFLTQILRLQQAKYVINKKETTIEEVAYAIKDQKDLQDEDRAQRSFKKP
jgi:hypothetical protein